MKCNFLSELFFFIFGHVTKLKYSEVACKSARRKTITRDMSGTIIMLNLIRKHCYIAFTVSYVEKNNRAHAKTALFLLWLALSVRRLNLCNIE